jgi:uncharacterized membrane protein YgdD (TMEM256/DUF423 family)
MKLDHARIFLVLGAVSALTSVVLGAVTAHALSGTPVGAQSWFQTALQYHQFHALGLLAVGLIAARSISGWIVASGWLMAVGIVLFSGNLYLRSLADFHVLHAATPFGGGAFMLAWLALAIGVARDHR